MVGAVAAPRSTYHITCRAFLSQGSLQLRHLPLQGVGKRSLPFGTRVLLIE